MFSATARIQFRLPDGSSFTNQFSSQDKLQEARQFVVQVCFWYEKDSCYWTHYHNYHWSISYDLSLLMFHLSKPKNKVWTIAQDVTDLDMQ